MSTNIIRNKKFTKLKHEIYEAKYLYILLILPFAYFVIFHYLPMYGIIIAFKDYNVFRGIIKSPWVGFKHFIDFLTDSSMPVLFKNTFLIGIVTYLFSGWPNVIFALMLNELKNGIFRKTVITVTNIPNYLSVVIVAGMAINLLSPTDGLVNILLQYMGIEPIHFIVQKAWFIPIYVGTGIWQGLGFGSLLYLAVISNISLELYEAADIEGATRINKAIYITIPHLLPTFILTMIMAVAFIIGPSFEKIMLLYTPATYDVSDVISTYVYRKGLTQGHFSYAAAIGFFNSLLSLAFVLGTNYASKKVSEYSMF